MGLIWLVFCYKLYASPAAKLENGALSQAEYNFIHNLDEQEAEQEAEQADVAKEKVSWFKLLTFRQTWAFVFGRFSIRSGGSTCYGSPPSLRMRTNGKWPKPIQTASRLGQINTWLAVGTISIACAAHAAWSANIFTTVSDMFPKKAVASVTGIGGMAGALGGMLIAFSAGLLLAHYKLLHKVEVGYSILFVICGSAYLTAWVLMHLLVPKFKKIVL